MKLSGANGRDKTLSAHTMAELRDASLSAALPRGLSDCLSHLFFPAARRRGVCVCAGLCVLSASPVAAGNLALDYVCARHTPDGAETQNAVPIALVIKLCLQTPPEGLFPNANLQS
jgi:hypothetical protein